MRNKHCCSSYKHLTHHEALQNTVRKVDIKQVFIFISHQRFCPAHCYLSDESLSFHSLSLLGFYIYNIYIKCLLFLQNFTEKNSLIWCCNKALYICLCHADVIQLWLKHVLLFVLVERDDAMFNTVCLGFPALAGALVALLPSLNVCIWSCLAAKVTGKKDYLEPMGYVKFCFQAREPPPRRPSGSVLRSKYIACAPALTLGFIPWSAWPELGTGWWSSTPQQGEKTPASSQLKNWFGKPPPERAANYSRGVCKAF